MFDRFQSKTYVWFFEYKQLGGKISIFKIEKKNEKLFHIIKTKPQLIFIIFKAPLKVQKSFFFNVVTSHPLKSTNDDIS